MKDEHTNGEKLTDTAEILKYIIVIHCESEYTLTISSPIKMSFRFANCNINRTSLIAHKSIFMLESKKFQNLELNTEF